VNDWLILLNGEDEDEPRIAGSFALEGRADLGKIAKLALEESGATGVSDLMSYEESGEA
jgi:hypothetical protein